MIILRLISLEFQHHKAMANITNITMSILQPQIHNIAEIQILDLGKACQVDMDTHQLQLQIHNIVGIQILDLGKACQVDMDTPQLQPQIHITVTTLALELDITHQAVLGILQAHQCTIHNTVGVIPIHLTKQVVTFFLIHPQ